MIARSIAEDALRAALSTGGDFAEIFYQDKIAHDISMIDGRMENSLTQRLHGAGIRVFHGLNCVYVHTADTSASGLLRAAKRAADAIGGAAKDAQVNLIARRFGDIHPIVQMPIDVAIRRKADLLLAANDAAKGASGVIAHTSAGLSTSNQEIGIFNSEGLMARDERTYTRMRFSAVASDGTQNQTGFAGPGGLIGFELFDEIDVPALGRQAAISAETMLRADACPAGRMPVVMDGGFGGVIFHEACGHSLEATAVAFGKSEFCGKLGQTIASEKVTAIDDGTIPNAWGSTNIDDEGAPTTRLVLIENGVLKNYMIDKLNGRRMEMPSTGSGRRQDYTFAPTSRMRNTYIAAGTDDDDEMIASTEYGLYARCMGGGSVNPATGEFNFAVAEGYMIRNGSIAEPVRGATLVGRGAELLKRIDRVGRNMTMAQGVCGSISGSVPTNVGQPRIRVSEITVGGR